MKNKLIFLSVGIIIFLSLIWLLSTKFEIGYSFTLFQHLAAKLPTKHKLPVSLIGLIYSLIVFSIILLTYTFIEKKGKAPGFTYFGLFFSIILITSSLSLVNIMFYSIIYLLEVNLPSPVILLPYFIIDPIIIALGFTYLRVAFRKDKSFLEDIVRGSKIYHDPKEALKQIKSCAQKSKADGIHIHPKIKMPMAREMCHILIIASPGSGKTQALFPMIQDIKKRGDGLFLYDFKGDYTSAFGEEEGTIVLSPFDKRGIAWDIAFDIDNDVKAFEFASTLITSPKSTDDYFIKAAQDILTGIIIKLQKEKQTNWNFKDLVSILSDKQKIIDSCNQCRPAAIQNIGALDGKQADGVFGMLRTSTIQIEYLARAWNYEGKNQSSGQRFSINRWIEDDDFRSKKPLVIIKGSHEYREVSRFLTVELFTALIKKVENLSDSYERRIWLCLDEFGNVPKIQYFDEMLTTVRSKGLRIIIAVQDIAQIEKNYGKSFTQTFFNCFGTLLAGLTFGETASYLAKIFGQNQIERTTTGESVSSTPKSLDAKKTDSTSQNIITENALLDSDFSNLMPPSLKTPAYFWLKIPGWPVGKLAFNVKPMPQEYKPNIKPDWVNKPNQIKERKIDLDVEVKDGFKGNHIKSINNREKSMLETINNEFNI